VTILTKDPDDKADFAVDFAALLNTGETLSNPTVTVPAGITLTTPAAAVSGSKVVFWLLGGTDGGEYAVDVECDTSGGRHFADTPLVLVYTRT
jgi:hypothetical protein